MRPKTVLVILLVAVGVLGSVVLLKALLKEDGAGGPIASEEATNLDATTPANPVKPPVTDITATTPAQDRQARIDKELDALKEALLAGDSDPVSAATVTDRLLHPEAEVRKAAVETAVHLNLQSAIPRLKEAMNRTEDPREKVAILDAIAYLELGASQTPQTNNPSLTNDLPRLDLALRPGAGSNAQPAKMLR